MKKKQLIMSMATAMLIATMLLTSCGSDERITSTPNPFDEVAENAPTRDKVVVISDIHLGNDSAYSECVKHLPRLKQFLTQVRESKTIK